MPADWALHSIAVPGHELGEEPRPFEEVAEEAAAEILATVEGRIVLYGHCGAGTTLTASIARRLEAAGRPVEAIYLGGVVPVHPAPGAVRPVRRSGWRTTAATSRASTAWSPRAWTSPSSSRRSWS